MNVDLGLSLRKAALVAIVTVVIAHATEPAEGQVLLAESFESDPLARGWAASGSWALDSSVAYNGSNSLKIPGDGPPAPRFYYDLGAEFDDVTLEAWFFDDGDPQLEAYIGVTADPEHTLRSDFTLFGGLQPYHSPPYMAWYGWHTINGWTDGPSRSPGWHKVMIVNAAGVNSVYIDDQFVWSTSDVPAWRWITLISPERFSGGQSWFDDITVTLGPPIDAVPDPALSAATGGPSTVVVTPQAIGESLEHAGARIDITVRNFADRPIEGIPASDVWLEDVPPGDLAICGGSVIADAPTDALGHTTITGALPAGGCAMDGIYVVVQGVTITSSPLPISINSPDMTGDLSVDLIDVGQFAQALIGSYNPCADFFKNGVIDLVDVGILAAHVGEGCP